MIVDPSPNYTDPGVNVAINNPLVFVNYKMKKERSSNLYSQVKIHLQDSKFPFSVTLEKPKLKPTPTALKGAMAKISKRAIAKSIK